MSHEMKQLLKSAAPEVRGEADLEEIARRSRRVRKGRFLSVVAVFAVASLGIASGIWLFSGSEDAADLAPPADTSEGKPVTPERDLAATFALWAVTEVGLRSADGEHLDYLGIEAVDGGWWLASFELENCQTGLTDIGYRCVPLEEAPVSIAIDRIGSDFTVTDVRGPVSPQHRSQLLDLRHEVKDEGGELIAKPILIDKGFIVASTYWTGKLSYMPLGAAQCRIVLHGPAGDYRWPKDRKTIYVSSHEEKDRDSIVASEFTQDIAVDSVSFACVPPRYEPPYEHPDIPEEIEYVNVGPDIQVPDELTVGGHFEHREEGFVDGPQYVVAHGVFDVGKWGRYEGREWKLLAWGKGETYCQSYVVEPGSRPGVGCSSPNPNSDEDPDPLLGHITDPGTEFLMTLVTGAVSKDVSTIEFRLDNGKGVRVQPIEPPNELDLPVNYFAAFLPPGAADGQMIALDPAGDELQRGWICNDYACLAGDR